MYNTAENNDKLWKVKAHIVIMPVRLPDGLPDDEKIDDFRLLSNGQLVNMRERLPKVNFIQQAIYYSIAEQKHL